MRPPKLAEEHRDKLAPTAEATCLIFSLVVADSLFGFVSWKEL
jgi:hypothetical protein